MRLGAHVLTRAVNRHALWVLLTAQVVTAALAAGIGLGRAPFWRDEVASASIAGRDLAGLFSVLGKIDANNGLYYLLLHFWMVPNASEGWLRALSSLFAVAAVPVTALLARHLFNERVAILAGFILALNGYFVSYAQEARTYALAMFLTALASLQFVRAVARPGMMAFLGYGVASILAVYANPFTLLVLLAHFVSLVFLPKGRAPWRLLLVTQAAIALPTAPFALVVLAQGHGQTAWVPPSKVYTLAKLGFELAGAGPYRSAAPRGTALLDWVLTLAYGLCVVLALVAAGRAWRARGADQNRWRTMLVVVWCGLPPVLLLAASLVTPLFLSRYLIGCLPALAILVGAGLATVRRRVCALGLAGLIFGLSLIAITGVKQDAYQREDLRGAASLVARQGLPEDAIGYAPAFTRVGFGYYLERSGVGPDRLPRDVGLAPDGRPEQVGDLFARELDEAAVARAVAAHQRVWVVGYGEQGGAWHPTPEPMSRVEATLLRSDYTIAEIQHFGGLRVRLYQRR